MEQYNFNVYHTISYTADDTNLPDGTYPILIKTSTQEKFDCIIDWDLSPLEPHKIVLMERVRNDLEELGEASDFYPLKNQIKVGIAHFYTYKTCIIQLMNQNMKINVYYFRNCNFRKAY